MARLAIELTTGDSHSYDITPAAEYAFEQEFNTGIYKRFRDLEKQSDTFWLAHWLLAANGVTVKPFGADFVSTLKDVRYVAETNPKENGAKD